MFKSFIFSLLTQISLSVPDACSITDPISVCQESGYCSEPLTHLTCNEAYIFLSRDLQVAIDQPPITPQYDQAATGALAHFRKTAFGVPGEWISEPSFLELHRCFEAIVVKFQSQFPLIIVDIPLLQRLVDTAANVRTRIGVPMFESGDRKSFGNFLVSIVRSGSMRDVEAYFEAIVEYLSSTDILDPIRRAILSNLGPYLHAWLTTHQRLGLPYPFHGRGFIEILTHVAQFDPLYPLIEGDRVWTIPMDHRVPYYYMPPFVVDIAGESNIEDFFVSFIERVEGIDLVPSRENILRVIQNEVERVLVEPNIHSITLSEIFNVIKPFLFYLRTQILGSDISLEPFCRSTKANWRSLFTIISSWRAYGSYPYLLEIFRICGQQYLSVSDRVMIVLPTIIGFRDLGGNPTTLGSAIHELRRGVDFIVTRVLARRLVD